MKKGSRFGRLFLVFLLNLVFLSAQVFAQNTPVPGDHFKTGTLKDFTPAEISADAVTVNPKGPLFLICGISRAPFLMDFRPEKQKEKIHFKLSGGKGAFASFQQPDKRTNQEFSAVPGHEGLVEVLFYPDAGKGPGVVSIDVTTTGAEGVTGSLNYRFNIAPLDDQQLKNLRKGNFKFEVKAHGFVRDETIETLTDAYDKDGNLKPDRKTMLGSMKADGSSEMREGGKKGKVIQSTKAGSGKVNEGDLPVNQLEPWGYSNKGEAIFVKKPVVRENLKAIWEFLFYDQTGFQESERFTLSSNTFNSLRSTYDLTGKAPFKTKQELTNGYLWGPKISHWIVTHTLVPGS